MIILYNHIFIYCFTFMKNKHFRKIKTKKSKKNGRRHQSSKKKHSYSHRLQKGGLRQDTNHGEALGITNTWSFNNEATLKSFQEYIFGSNSYAHLWTTLLEACKSKGIPVYIISNGNLIGIIRTIQLLGLSDDIKEVISTRADDPSKDPKNQETDSSSIPINPVINPERHFAEKTKAEVIKRIMGEEGIPCDSESLVGAFFDDYDENFKGVCESIAHVPTETKKRIMPKDSIFKTLRANAIYNKLRAFRHSSFLNRLEDNYNFTPLQFLLNAIRGITGQVEEGTTLTDNDRMQIELFKNIRILFLDWDRTVSVWPGAISFQLAKYYEALNDVITVS